MLIPTKLHLKESGNCKKNTENGCEGSRIGSTHKIFSTKIGLFGEYCTVIYNAVEGEKFQVLVSASYQLRPIKSEVLEFGHDSSLF